MHRAWREGRERRLKHRQIKTKQNKYAEVIIAAVGRVECLPYARWYQNP